MKRALELHAAGKSNFDIAREIGMPIGALGQRLDLALASRVVCRSGVERPCLRCERPFASEGKHHRICNLCKESDDWCGGAAGHSFGAGYQRRPAAADAA